MTKKPLRLLFDAMHHGKYRYEEFLNDPVQENFRRQLIGPPRKRREILIPNKRLKDYQTFLNLFAFEYLPVREDAVFSYRKGASALQAVEKHRQSRYFLQMDIRNFFPSIGRKLLEQTIARGIDKTPIVDLHEHLGRILDLVCIDNQLPLGFPSSSPLSNAVLSDFDTKLIEYCSANQLRYTRYSDDLIISSDQPIPDGCIKTSQEFLETNTLGTLSIHPGKTKLFQTGGKIKILGMMILPNGKITVDSKIREELEVLLHFYITDRKKFIDRSDGKEQDGLEKAAGYLTYAKSIDPEYINRLRQKFGATTVDMFLHRSFPQ